MKKITVYEVYKYDDRDRPYGRIGKKFKTPAEAELVIEMEKMEIDYKEGPGASETYYFITAKKEMNICETMEEYNEMLKDEFSRAEDFATGFTSPEKNEEKEI